MGKWLIGSTEEECTSQILARPRCSEVSDPAREMGPTEVGMEVGMEVGTRVEAGVEQTGRWSS